MNKQKSPHDVKGWQMDCINYEMCPICYGCRAYDQSRIKCINRCGNNKKNICNTKLHQDNLIAKMIKKEHININK